MDAYGLTREDWTTLTEELGGSFSLVHTKDIPTATKSAFTRKYVCLHGKSSLLRCALH